MKHLIRLIACLAIAVMSLGCRAKYVTVPHPITVPIPADSAIVAIVVDCPEKGLPPIIRTVETKPGTRIRTAMRQNGNKINIRATSPPDTIIRYVETKAKIVEVPSPPRYINKVTILQKIRMTVGDIALLALTVWGAPKLIRLIKKLKII